MDALKDLFLNGYWYHCITHNGIKSNGAYDIEKYLKHYKFEPSYSGKEILDVGASDGYFSILLKERGAKRVCAIDSNKYDGSVTTDVSLSKTQTYIDKYKFRVNDYEKFKHVYDQYHLKNHNKLLLLSKIKNVEIEYKEGNIYDLTKHGQFDIVLCGSLLEHLKDPIKAIEQLYFATKELCIIDLSSTLKSNFLTKIFKTPLLQYKGHLGGGSFYNISEEALYAMCHAAGFKNIKTAGRFYMHNRRAGSKNYHVVVHAFK